MRTPHTSERRWANFGDLASHSAEATRDTTRLTERVTTVGAPRQPHGKYSDARLVGVKPSAGPAEKGIALVEILVVIAIIGITVFSLYELVVLSRATVSRELRRTQALSYAQEGIEAVRTIRDQGWNTNIAPLSNGTDYYATLSGSAWALTTTNPGPLDSLFNRTIVFASVNRDANSNISESGSADANTRKVTSTINWTDRGTSRSVALSTYITNFLDN